MPPAGVSKGWVVEPNFKIRLRRDSALLTLAHLNTFGRELQRTLSAVARHLADSDQPGVEFPIVHAEVGSFCLQLQGLAADGTIDPAQVFDTFLDDVSAIRRHQFRSTMTPGLAGHYRSLVRTFSDSDLLVEYAYKGRDLLVDNAFRAAFEVALRERVVENTVIVGHLDAVSVHRAPFVFKLYPKLDPRSPVECRFPQAILAEVATHLKSLVQVRGVGFFAPVGLLPTRLEVQGSPERLRCDRVALRGYVRKLRLVPAGTTAKQYLSANRERAGFAD